MEDIVFMETKEQIRIQIKYPAVGKEENSHDCGILLVILWYGNYFN